VVVWDLTAWRFSHTFPSYEGGIHSLAYIPERDLILAGCENSLIYRWKRAEREKLPPLTEHDYDVTALVVLDQGQTLISGDMLGSLRVWDVRTGRCIRIWRAHEQMITGLAIWEQNQAFISASRDGTMRVWDRHTGECVRVLEVNSRSIEALVVDMSRQQLIAGDASGAHSWSLTTFEHLWSIEEPDIVDLSVDGYQLVTLGCRSGLSVWHLPAEQADHDRPIDVISV
jgi:WD40 repeat protein